MHLLSELGAWLMGVPAATLNFLKGTVAALAASPQVQQIATDEVQAVEDAVISGALSGSEATSMAKLAAAQKGVIAKLAVAGVPVVMNQVNLAIEGAVANLRAAKGAAPASAPAPSPAPTETASPAVLEAAAGGAVDSAAG